MSFFVIKYRTIGDKRFAYVGDRTDIYRLADARHYATAAKAQFAIDTSGPHPETEFKIKEIK